MKMSGFLTPTKGSRKREEEAKEAKTFPSLQLERNFTSLCSALHFHEGLQLATGAGIKLHELPYTTFREVEVKVNPSPPLISYQPQASQHADSLGPSAYPCRPRPF
jgi:hypothetical protein